MNTKSACYTELKNRIDQATRLIKSAFNCYKHGDFLQCAVRLQGLEKFGKFTELEMNIFESESEEKAEGARKG